MNETNKDKCIEDYIAQLEKYKNSVISGASVNSISFNKIRVG